MATFAGSIVSKEAVMSDTKEVKISAPGLCIARISGAYCFSKKDLKHV
jgi:hypothetical protein